VFPNILRNGIHKYDPYDKEANCLYSPVRISAAKLLVVTNRSR
jgi:hypothetical protein